MVLCWLLEETGRRIMMARLEFWRLVINDATYIVVTLVALVALLLTGRSVSLLLMLVAMAIGAIASIVLALFQVPRREYAHLRVGRAGFAEVARFAVWRAMHASLRPLQLLVARVLLQQLVSLAAVGAVEAGRLVVAPIQTVINGAGSVLLSTSAHEQRRPTGATHRLAERAGAVLVTLTLVGGLIATVFAHPLGRLMAGTTVDPLLVLGWVLYLTLWGAAMGYITEAVTRRLTRAVFQIRLLDSVVGVVALVVGLRAGLGYQATPWLLSSGALYSVLRTRHLAIRTRPTAQPTSIDASEVAVSPYSASQPRPRSSSAAVPAATRD
jgi:O-antigen/teichoic acid export membrane protein